MSGSIGVEGVSSIGEALKQNRTLNSLRSVLRFDFWVTPLSLSGNNIGTQGTASIGEALKLNQTLTELKSV